MYLERSLAVGRAVSDCNYLCVLAVIGDYLSVRVDFLINIDVYSRERF